MDTRLLRILILILIGIIVPQTAYAAAALGSWNSANWWRNTSTLDLDFYNDRYYLNGTTYTAGSGNTGAQNFIAGSGATFSRPGATVTATGAPFYLASNQSFVSRAVTTATYTAYAVPFYLSGSQIFVSRAATTATYTAYTAPFYLSGSQAFSSRASTATYFNSSGVLSSAATNTARSNYTYNGSAWTLAGTLIEATATNLAIDSATIGGTGWNNSQLTAASGFSAPDGSTSAYQLTDNTVNTTHVTAQVVSSSVSTNNTYTWSVYAKAGTDSWVRVQYNASGDAAYAFFNLSTGAIGTINASGMTTPVASIQNVGNGWYRCSITVAPPVATGALAIYMANSNGDLGSAGTGSGTIYVWGAQFELGSTATSYIPTTSATVTRSPDVYTSPFDGTYFDNTGTLQTDTTSVARDTHNPVSPYADLGTVLEPAATNAIRNNVGVGAIVSTAIPAQTISSMTDSSGTATVTTASAHGLAVGSTVVVSGASPSNYNGTFAVASIPTSTTFTYVMASDPGGSATTIGSYTAASSGTAPTNWTPAASNGLTYQIVDTGQEEGINYVDVRFVGLSNGVIYPGIFFDGNTNYAASAGAIASLSAYVKLQAGSLSNITSTLVVMTSYNSSGTALANYATQRFTPTTASLSNQRQLVTSSPSNFSNTATAYLRPYVQVNVTGAGPVDVTLRIGLPQMETSNYMTSVIPTSGTSVTRSADVYSTPFDGTYFNSSGVMQTATTSVVRTNYNPNTLALLGSLIEPAATNLEVNSANLSISSSIFNAALTPDDTTSPDGTTDAALFLPNTTSTSHYISLAGTTQTNGTTYTLSFYAAPDGITELYYGVNGVGAGYVNLSTCAFLTGDAGPTYSVTSVNNGWCYITETYTANATAAAPYIYAYNGSTTFAGTGSAGFYIWGVQVEQSSYATTYIPTSGSTVTRNADVYQNPNGGTYFNSSGVMQTAGPSVPRLDHSPTGNYYPLGILIEESRTNLVPASTNYTSWLTLGGTPSLTSNTTLAPDGTTTATTLTNSSSSAVSDFYLTMSPTAASGTAFTFSAFVTNASIPGGDTCPNIVNMGGASQINFGSATSITTAIGTNYVRCSYTATTTTANGAVWPQIVVPANSSTIVWGAQLEQGAYPTSYIPTTTAAVTRSADVFILPSTAAGANGAWYTAGVGTFLVNAMVPYVDSNASDFHRFIEMDDGTSTANNLITLSESAGADRAAINTSGTAAYAQNYGSTVANTLIEGAVAYNSSNVFSAFNGTSLTSGSSISIPTINTLVIGGAADGTTEFLDGWVSRATYFLTQQPNASLPGYTPE